jgi:CheY-like chemotaxis protein
MDNLAERFCKGLRVLLVEDESVIAMLTENMLAELGCEDIAIAGSIAQALNAIDRNPPDLAVLDVNLRGQMVLPVAEKLAAAGIPFAFATGYGASDVLAGWKRYPVIQKPFGMPELERALRQALAIT